MIPKFQLFNIYYSMYLIDTSADIYKNNYIKTLQSQIDTWNLSNSFNISNLLNARQSMIMIYKTFKTEIDKMYDESLNRFKEYFNDSLKSTYKTLFVNMFQAKIHNHQHFEQSETDFALLDYQCKIKYSLPSQKIQRIKQSFNRLKKTEYAQDYDNKYGECKIVNMVIYEGLLRYTNMSHKKGNYTRTISSPLIEKLNNFFDNLIQNIDDIPEIDNIEVKFDKIVKIPFKNYKKFLLLEGNTIIKSFNRKIIGQKNGYIYIDNSKYSTYGQREYTFITQLKKIYRTTLFNKLTELDIIASNESILKLGQLGSLFIKIDPFQDIETKISFEFNKNFNIDDSKQFIFQSNRDKIRSVAPLLSNSAIKTASLISSTGSGSNAVINNVYKSIFNMDKFTYDDYMDAQEVNDVINNPTTPNYFSKKSKFYGQNPRVVQEKFKHIQLMTSKLKNTLIEISEEGKKMVTNIIEKEEGTELDLYIRSEIKGNFTKAKWMSVYTTIVEKGFRNYIIEKIEKAGGVPLFQCHDAIYCDMSNADISLLGNHNFMPFINFKGTEVK